MYYYRAKILEPLVAKYNVKLWGPSMPLWLNSPVKKAYQGRSVTELEKSKAFNAGKIVLNTTQGAVSGVNQRFFEIAGCGGFQIFENNDTKAVDELLTIGKEVIVFDTVKDLMEKVDYYLRHPEERKKIADAAYERAHREHTFQKRLETMLEVIRKNS
jgi:spore maturation protein CgeB